MEKTIYIGVDPGKAGFITIFDDYKKEFKHIPMPTHKIETGELTKTGKAKTKTVFHEEGLKDIVIMIHNSYKGYERLCAIEDVHGREGWSAQNNFTFGDTAGLQRMCMIMLGCEITKVRPQKWQSYMGQGYKQIKKPSSTGKTMVNDAKAMSDMIATTEYPNIDFRKTERSSKNDDNKIDSFLICMYLYRTKNQ